MLDALILLFGLALLLGGGMMLVRGASDIAQTYGISPVVIGLTVVGFGTSAPELVVNVIGASRGETDLAFGNVIGSNISNLALVLGAAALMMPIDIQRGLVKRELPFLLLATSILTVMGLDGLLENRIPAIGRSDALVLTLLFGVIVYTNVLELFFERFEDPLLIEVDASPLVVARDDNRWRWPITLGGIALLFGGGHFTVQGASAVAINLGVPATTIGLFVVAIGTSLPELVTSVIAAIRKECELALGNIIGSNLFNSLIVLPVSGMIAPVTIPEGGLADLVVSWALAAFLIPVFFFGQARLGRAAGVFLIVSYFTYATARIASTTAG